MKKQVFKTGISHSLLPTGIGMNRFKGRYVRYTR